MCMAMLGESEWTDHMNKLSSIVGNYWNEMLPFLGVPVAFTAALAAFVFRMTDTREGRGLEGDSLVANLVLLPVVFLTFLIVIGGRAFIVQKNTALDTEVHGWCRDVTIASGRAVHVQYRTRWTGSPSSFALASNKKPRRLLQAKERKDHANDRLHAGCGLRPGRLRHGHGAARGLARSTASSDGPKRRGDCHGSSWRVCGPELYLHPRRSGGYPACGRSNGGGPGCGQWYGVSLRGLSRGFRSPASVIPRWNPHVGVDRWISSHHLGPPVLTMAHFCRVGHIDP
ncbi:unnamed protein product [Effrenium voratum]|nr:unnamed protein product [Effrenium voratum]